MPIYQYRCADCGHEMDALQKMSDPKLTDCPACNASALKKQVTAAAFKLKGTGWYETDFKNSGAKPAKVKPGIKTETQDLGTGGVTKGEGSTASSASTNAD